MGQHLAVVEQYLDGFRTGDHRRVLDCLSEDVVWQIHGHRTTHGKAEFDTEIENDTFLLRRD